MLILLKQNALREDVEALRDALRAQQLDVQETVTGNETAFLVSGETWRTDAEALRAQKCVKQVIRLREPYTLVSREKKRRDTVIPVGNAVLGGGDFCLIAGPCTVESAEQMLSAAQAVKESGAKLLRGGAYKPRTSPYTFQGLGKEGLRLLVEAGREVGLPVVSEIMDASGLDAFADVDVLQVGARNMRNYALLHALGQTDKPVLLKRGDSASLTELLLSAEHIAAAGNEKIILCERGERGFSPETRNVLDLSAVPLLREKTHLPVIVDPSHATGLRRLVPAMSMAAAVVGADGLMLEVHTAPETALCDGQQSVSAAEFASLAEALRNVLPHRMREEF